MFNQIFPYLLVGLIAWNLARGARQRQASNFATAAAGFAALLGHSTQRSVLYLGALALLGWSFYLQASERKRRARGSQHPDQPERPSGVSRVPARLPGETADALIERHVLGIRTAPDVAEMRARARVAHRALHWLSVAELRPVFALVTDPNAAVRSLALPLLIEKGDDAALELLRAARGQYRDMDTGYVLAVCHRGSPALEPELTHPERERRREALLLLVRAATGRVYPALGSERPELARLLAALLVESDGELLLELCSKLAEHSQLGLVSEHWPSFSAPSRRALLRLAQLGSERAQLEDLVALFRQALGDAEPKLVRAAVRAVRQPGAEALCAALGDPALPLRGWLELTLHTAGATVACKEGGSLRIAPGPLRLRLRLRQLSSADLQYARVLLELCDSEGHCWQLRSYVRGCAFTAELLEPERRVPLLAARGVMSWSQAPAAWQQALRERCLLARLPERWEQPDQMELALGTRKHALALQHQSPSLDVALLGEQVLVRASQLRENKFRGIGPFRVFEGSAPLAPLAWLAPATSLLCFAEPTWHYARVRELEDREGPERRRSCRARRLERVGEGQEAVVFECAGAASE